MTELINIPDVGSISTESGFLPRMSTGDELFRVGKNGVVSVSATGDRKVEFVAFQDRTLACVKSSVGYPAYYPVHPVRMRKPVKAVLMDLDGTSVKSEDFWIWIIQKTAATLIGNDKFELEEDDLPYVSGHSVSEHLGYCIDKYCPGKSLESAREAYFSHTHREMKEIVAGRGRADAFVPAPGVGEFLMKLKEHDIKIGLVTSGLYEKAWPEILSAFKTLGMGEPKDFYDAIITAGFPLRNGNPGTLGELSPKPHPWLYAEVSRVGLGIPFKDRNSVVGIEDSGAGVCSVRLAGFPTIGLAGGNIRESGTHELCSAWCENFEDIAGIIL